MPILSSPRSARRGNWMAAVGMVLAVAWTVVVLHDSFTPAGIIICGGGLVVGGVTGVISARVMKMTAMPQMVALFNGVGGGAAALVALPELLKLPGHHPEFQMGFPSMFVVIIGGISLVCSLSCC
jgi:H+-translocating NAD(P) transhydrogenase subunit beta